jgi:transcription-repair coupling factor (superfamily II helicase)
MREHQLEKIMSDFYHLRFNVLVCTTIIESGIDVPTANTIIIDRADRFGLAQLHQLRGRVGRSHHQAYAYLLVTAKGALTQDAEKRLEAITAMEDLGAGFNLATHDLEIRGAGELLGEEQSGQIEGIGFSLYMEYLQEAIEALKHGKEPSFEDLAKSHLEIDIKIPALFPNDYINDVHLRLTLYKRIANAQNDYALLQLREEIIDRFGVLPEASKNLFRITSLRLLAEKIGILKIVASPVGGVIEFSAKPSLEPMQIIGLIQKQPDIYKLKGASKLEFRLPISDNKNLQIAQKSNMDKQQTTCLQFLEQLLESWKTSSLNL